MKARLVSIGDSKGIKIPAVILKQCHIENEVNLEIEKDMIILKSAREKPREGWNEAFRLMHEKKDDILLLDETADVKMEDWEWK